MRDWTEIQDTVFDDTIEKLACDTRDFCCISYPYEPDEKKIDLSKIKKYPDFFYTIEEVKAVLEDLYQRSEGANSWRMLTFKDNGTFISTGNWNLKYIRVYKTPMGYVMSDDKQRCVRKAFWKQEIEEKYLAAH